MRGRQIYFRILLASLIPLSPAHASMLCSHVFEDSARELKIQDLLLRSNENSKLTHNFKLQLAALYQTTETTYGPLEFKSGKENINWTQLKTHYLREAAKTEKVSDQYFLMAEFLAHFNDGHVSIQIPSTYLTQAPLQLMASQSQLFVNAYMGGLSASSRQPQPGDRVVSIDGVSPKDYIKRTKVWDASGNEVTNLTQFAVSFGWWSEASGIPSKVITSTPGKLRMEFESATSGDRYTVELPLKGRGISLVEKDGQTTPITVNPPRLNDPYKVKPPRLLDLPKTSKVLSGFHELFKAKVEKQDTTPKAQDGLIHLGKLEPFFKLPDNFKPIQLPNSQIRQMVESRNLLAGTFQHNGKNVGFLRIPSYEVADFGLAIRHLRYLIHQLQKSTDYLIIDQTNNPGGMVVYSDLIIRSLTGETREDSHIRFAVKPTQQFLRQYLNLRDQVAKNPENVLTPQELNSFLERIDREYAKIKRAYDRNEALSEPVSMLVISDFYNTALAKELEMQIPGTPYTLKQALLSEFGVDFTQNQVYKKPVYMMINELDFSAGDATPAALKDYGRVKLIGTRTAGAGGTVNSFSFSGSHEFTVNLTTSLMVRKDGSLVENYGVKPDIELPILPTDIQDRYTSYFTRVLEAVTKDLQGR